jgi:hypothetical protein
MEKIFKQRNFNNFVWVPLGGRVNIYIHFCLQVHFKVSAASYCSNYLLPVSTTPAANLPPVSPPASLTPAANLPPVALTPVANLPPVSTAQGKLVAKFAAGVVDTGGNLPPVSLTPVVHLDLQISPRIFEQIQNGPNGTLWGWGETHS